MMRSIRTAFFTGILIVLPIGVTGLVIGLILDTVGNPASALFFRFIDSNIRELPSVGIPLEILSLVIVFIIITLLGYGSRIFLGRMLFNFFEGILGKVPFINLVYNTVKQIVDTFSQQNNAIFQEVVLIEYPRKGIYAVGFLTNQARGEIQEKTGEHLVNVFVPTTPNPTSGFLLMLPNEAIIPMEMTIAEGMKLIISGGAVAPPYSGHLEQGDDKLSADNEANKLDPDPS